MVQFFKKLIYLFDQFMMRPKRVFIFLFCFLFLILLFNESFFKVSSLYHKLNSLAQEEKDLKQELKDLALAQDKLKDPEYVEFLVKDRLNWSKKKELLFLFIEGKNK